MRAGPRLLQVAARAFSKTAAFDASLFIHAPMTRALRAASSMQIIEGLTDAEIAEAHRSADIFAEVKDMTAPLDAVLCLLHALDWLELNTRTNRVILESYLLGVYGDPVQIALGKIAPLANGNKSEKTKADAQSFTQMLAQARELIGEERFLNWQVAFPGVWTDWESSGLSGGFDAIIGNPPWDRMKLQQVEWFAARRREIALAQRASDRTRMVDALGKAGDPLASGYAKAEARAEAGFRMARASGDYPLLSGGDVNIYSLFVERAMQLVKPDGIVGLLTPSGIASDKTAAPFFKAVATTGRLKALYDFENRRTRFQAAPFFPDVDSRFKFCASVMSPARTFETARCAFFLQDVSELADPERCFPLTAHDFARVNPNTGTAPIFKTRRDAALTTAIYGRLPILVDRSKDTEIKAWPVRYSTMFHMTNDSGLFRTQHELEEKEGAYPIGGNCFRNAEGDWMALYEGKMVQSYDHRAASVVVNPDNQHRPAQPEAATDEQHRNPAWIPNPQFWVKHTAIPNSIGFPWLLAYKMITATTNARTIIGAVLPEAGLGNSMGMMIPDENRELFQSSAPYMVANINSVPFDFVIRQKIQGQNINWYMVEQLPVVPIASYAAKRFGKKPVADIVREAVLELTYTAHDMVPFARDMGYVDKAGKVKPPFKWVEARRIMLRAKLDAIYFHLYGITDRDDVRYIYSTFPIVEREETTAHGRYLSRDLCLAWMSALAAGNPDAEIRL